MAGSELRSTEAELAIGSARRDHPLDVQDYDLIAQELSNLGEKIRGLDDRLAEVERVNARLEDAALTTARALGEIPHHWDAVYEAMCRAERVDTEEEEDPARLRTTEGPATPGPPANA